MCVFSVPYLPYPHLAASLYFASLLAFLCFPACGLYGGLVFSLPPFPMPACLLSASLPAFPPCACENSGGQDRLGGGWWLVGQDDRGRQAGGLASPLQHDYLFCFFFHACLPFHTFPGLPCLPLPPHFPYSCTPPSPFTCLPHHHHLPHCLAGACMAWRALGGEEGSRRRGRLACSYYGLPNLPQTGGEPAYMYSERRGGRGRTWMTPHTPCGGTTLPCNPIFGSLGQGNPSPTPVPKCIPAPSLLPLAGACPQTLCLPLGKPGDSPGGLYSFPIPLWRAWQALETKHT